MARKLNVPVGTVGYRKHMDRAKRGERPGRHEPSCPQCHGRKLDEIVYSTESWPGLMDACETAMLAVFPDHGFCRVRRTGCSNVKVHSKHVHCLFPQHAPGKKHERPIVLEAWQRAIVDAHPWDFIRGLIHSDGCRITNWTTRVVAGERKRYEYNISVAKKASVALMDTHVGPKH